MSRRPVIAGNWKMHKLQSESAELANAVMKELKEIDKSFIAGSRYCSGIYVFVCC